MTWRVRTTGSCLAALWLGACASGSIPEVNKSLRPVAVTSAADRQAYDVAEAASDQLNTWCQDARAVRERGEVLPDDDPLLDGRAHDAIGRLEEAAAGAATMELAAALRELTAAQKERLSILVAGRKFAQKRYIEAERKVAELSFGLRRWRQQR